MKTLILSGIVAYATLFAANARATTITSGFDTDLDGWTTNPQGTIAFVATGGNPDGFLEETDGSSSGNMHVLAPSKFLGDLSGAQTLSIDIKVFAQSISIRPAFGILTFSNSLSGSSISLDLGDPATAWTNYTTLLNPAAFGVEALTYTGVMSNVTTITLILEADNDVDNEVVGMDNFTISGGGLGEGASSVPEPALSALVGVALIACAGSRKHRRPRHAA